jgi:hypothetical protein
MYCKSERDNSKGKRCNHMIDLDWPIILLEKRFDNHHKISPARRFYHICYEWLNRMLPAGNRKSTSLTKKNSAVQAFERILDESRA